VVLAALRNALTALDKRLETARVVVLGAGAAGTAVTRLLLAVGARDVIVWAPVGVLGPHLAATLPSHKVALAAATNPRGVRGGLAEAMRGADAVVGVSAAGVLSRALVRSMALSPVVFALANPVPEIEPAEIADVAAVVATGRSDHPNQVNSALVFPGLFRGALDAHFRTLDTPVLLAFAQALTELVPSPCADRVLPAVLDPRVVPAVAAAVTAGAPRTPELPPKESPMSAMSPVPAVRPGHLTLGHHPEWEQVADLFATLSHPVRVRILELLADRPRTGSELVAALGLSPARLSRQLAVLRQAGLIGFADEAGRRHWAVLDESVMEVLSRARAVRRAAPTAGPATGQSRTAKGSARLTSRPTEKPTTNKPASEDPVTVPAAAHRARLGAGEPRRRRW
jgi:DNA-binding transcriptional ArsR family regulator